MTQSVLIDGLAARITALSPLRDIGRVLHVRGNTVALSGLEEHAAIGDWVSLRRRGGTEIAGEILRIDGESVTALTETDPDGVRLGDPASLHPGPQIAPGDHWLGRIIDSSGAPIDGKPLLPGAAGRPLRAAPPPAADRGPLGPRLGTGLAVTNTFLPIAAGQRLGLFAGSGVGKSTLLGQLARHLTADVVVIALIGERGRELRHFVTEVLGAAGLARSVVVTATSDQSPLRRRRCAWTAMAVAEHFRDAGKSVLLLADSLTRFAEAHRETAVAAGEPPVLRGFPASTPHALTALCERAGPGRADQGSITAVFTVLVAGSDMDEPVADILRGVLDGHIVLDRAIAEGGRFPAVDVLRSVSRSLPDAASARENAILALARRMLSLYDSNATMIRAGLYAHGSDPDIDKAIQLQPELDAFLAMTEPDDAQRSFSQLELVLRRAGLSV